MKIDRVEVGKRLLAYRDELNMKQIFVCNKTGLAQNTLSILENGSGGGFDSFLTLLRFYSKEFNVHNIFAARFAVLPKKTGKTPEDVLFNVAIKQIDSLQESMTAQFEDIKKTFKG